MKKIESKKIVEQYIKSGEILYDTISTGNYKKGNKEFKKMLKLYRYLEENIDIAKQTLPLLFEHENLEVRIDVATHCLMLGIYTDVAKNILDKIARNKDNGIFSINAEIGLQNWKSGKLKMH